MTDLSARIRRLTRAQRVIIQMARILWVLGALVALVQHEWVDALASTGAAVMASIALNATRARTALIVIEHRAKGGTA